MSSPSIIGRCFFSTSFFLFPSVIFFDSEMDYLFNNNNTGLKIITDFISLKTNYLCKTEPSTHPKVQTFFGTL